MFKPSFTKLQSLVSKRTYVFWPKLRGDIAGRCADLVLGRLLRTWFRWQMTRKGKLMKATEEMSDPMKRKLMKATEEMSDPMKGKLMKATEKAARTRS